MNHILSSRNYQLYHTGFAWRRKKSIKDWAWLWTIIMTGSLHYWCTYFYTSTNCRVEFSHLAKTNNPFDITLQHVHQFHEPEEITNISVFCNHSDLNYFLKEYIFNMYGKYHKTLNIYIHALHIYFHDLILQC